MMSIGNAAKPGTTAGLMTTLWLAAASAMGQGQGGTGAEIQLGAFMGAGGFLDGELSRPDDVDTYAFTMLATGTSKDFVQVDVRGANSPLFEFGTVRLNLFKADGSPFGSVQTGTGASNRGFAFLRLPDVPPGDYLIEIEEISGGGITA